MRYSKMEYLKRELILGAYILSISTTSSAKARLTQHLIPYINQTYAKRYFYPPDLSRELKTQKEELLFALLAV